MRLGDLYTFVNTPLGMHMQHSIQDTLAPWMSNPSDNTQVLCIGYVGGYMPDTNYTHVLAPLYHDTFHYLDMHKHPATVVADEDHLPFRNDSMHTVILVHALEHADSPWAMMAEINRLVVSGGRVVVVVPNRVSLWSRATHTPFSHGLPYTKKQLVRLMQMSGFVPIKHTYAVFFPPVSLPLQSTFAKVCNTLGKYFWQENGGVIIGIYEKQVLSRVKKTNPYTKLSALGAKITPSPEISTRIKKSN